MQRHPQVVDRAGEGCKVVDDVDGLCDVQVQRDVLVDEEELFPPEVLHVLERARVQVVDADDAIPLRDEVIAEMGTEKPGPASNDGRRHRRDATGGFGRPGAILTGPLQKLLPPPGPGTSSGWASG